MLAVKRLVGILPSGATLLRSVLLSALACVAAAGWPAPGILLLLKLPALSLLICLAYLVLGEFSAAEMNVLRSCVDWRSTPRESAVVAE